MLCQHCSLFSSSLFFSPLFSSSLSSSLFLSLLIRSPSRFHHSDSSDTGGGGRFGNAAGGGYRKPKEEAASSSSRSDFIEPLPSSFTGMFGEECSMYRLHGNVPQNVRQTVYKEFCKAKSGVMLCTGENESEDESDSENESEDESDQSPLAYHDAPLLGSDCEPMRRTARALFSRAAKNSLLYRPYRGCCDCSYDSKLHLNIFTLFSIHTHHCFPLTSLPLPWHLFTPP
jgi:hypothetical protein